MRLRHVISFALAVAAIPAAARGDAAGTSFCAQLSTDATQFCVPVERGTDAAWAQATAAWRDDSTRAPIITFWAQPGVAVDELVRSREMMLAYYAQARIAKSYAETKNVPSVLASLEKQKALLETIKARLDESKR
jgi:hypothetical protein